MTMRLSHSSLTGTDRTLVAVGTVSEASMFCAVRAGARAAVGAEGPEWSGPVRESRPNERGPALWTRLERTENGRESWLMIIEPPAGQRGPVEVYYGREG